jgi:hypothetical protein
MQAREAGASVQFQFREAGSAIVAPAKATAVGEILKARQAQYFSH